MEEEVPAEKCLQPGEKNASQRNFICGVVEGFYGRPWTTEQRKDLFRKLKKWGMDSYVYAPKDDYKHRAYWRELYTVEEADHLSGLIAAAKEHGVTFYYALSPGLDMTYSNQKEIQALKRKLDQVSQFGCEAFALLFDDIESELSKQDKEVFQTFANAQVSVTNEICIHLGNPKFLFCPTQYCSSRAVPTVVDSEYLNTLGSKLNHDIDIMWTGNKVISKIITLESIQEITEILRRPPVIWDNLHANDYDQKRVFLGPYSGRSPELIPHLRGVLTNPNCEFHANTIAIHTLAYWSQCSMDSKVNSSLSADIKLETENEDGTATEELPEDCCVSKKVYHPRIALKNAIGEWLQEFFIEKEAWGPITKPQPQVTMVMPIIPIIPSINTCMSLTTTTMTSTNSKTVVTVPEVNTTQLQAFADVCSTVNSSALNPITNPVMNSLVSPTKVVTNDDIPNPIPSNAASNIELPKKIPISIVSVPIMHSKTEESDIFCKAVISEITDERSSIEVNEVNEDGIVELPEEIVINEKAKAKEGVEIVEIQNEIEAEPTSGIVEDDVTIDEVNQAVKPENLENNSVGPNIVDEINSSPLSAGNEPMECSSSLTSQNSPKAERASVPSEDVIMAEEIPVNDLNCVMQVESSEPSPLSNAEMKDDEIKPNTKDEGKMSAEDLYLLCDLFYLPFEHGSRGIKLLTEFNWLKANANVLLSSDSKKSTEAAAKPEVAEWMRRAESFSELCASVQELMRKIATCANKEICHDLFSYVWDIFGALTLLNAFVKWLSLGRFPQNVYTFTQGSYTWFSKGWKEAFTSGDQEPWVFRGGLTADLQRLMPVDSGNDLFLYKLPELPTIDFNLLRPYSLLDEGEVNKVCLEIFMELNEISKEDIFGLPDPLRDLVADSVVGPFATLSPELCIVAHDQNNQIVGYAVAAIDVKLFLRNVDICWAPSMREKYPQSLLGNAENFTSCKKLNDLLSGIIKEFHRSEQQCPVEVSSSYPAVMSMAVLADAQNRDQGIAKRLLTVALAALRANGCFGVHVRVASQDTEQVQQYIKIGFTEIYHDSITQYVYMGRRF